MRAEDRKPAKRVFPLLQNLDLDTVTFAQVQSVGEPISIEDMNEQELQDLVLVNLARLCCAGEWTGLLEAGGAGEFSVELTEYNWDGDGDAVRVFGLPPYGTLERELNQSVVQNDEIALFPFVSPETGTISQVDLYVGTTDSGGTGAVDVGFYSDENGLPKSFLGQFVLATTSSGQVTQTTSSADVETVRGTQYWIGLYADNFASTATFMNVDILTSGSASACGEQYGSVSIPAAIFKTSAGGNATITDPSSFRPAVLNPINIGVKW